MASMNNRMTGKTGGIRKSIVTLLSPSKTTSKKAAAGKKSPPHKSAAKAEERRRQIAEAAYYIAQRRGFEAGHELDDWLLAEIEVELRENIQ